MPADSRTLADEGVVIEPSRLDPETLRELTGRMRNPRQPEADLPAGRATVEGDPRHRLVETARGPHPAVDAPRIEPRKRPARRPPLSALRARLHNEDLAQRLAGSEARLRDAIESFPEALAALARTVEDVA